MKQLTDEVQELACKAAASTGNARGVDSRDALAIVGAYQAALDTAQPEPVNQVLLKALSAMLTHSGMDEDEWSKPTFDQARAAIMLATTKTQECGMCGYVGTKTDAVGQCPRCHWDELQAQPEQLTDSYVQTVPDKCDRIVWRNKYYHLPLKETK